MRRLSVSILSGVRSLVAAALLLHAGAGAAAELERTRVVIGLWGETEFALPIHLAVAHARRDAGLEVDVVSFGGGARAAAAVASDSIQVAGDLARRLRSGSSRLANQSASSTRESRT